MPSLKIELTEEQAAQLESETLASGISRAKVIKQILDSHYSKLPESPKNRQVIANEKDAQIQQLERMLNYLYQLNYVLVSQKMLPIAHVTHVAVEKQVKRISLWYRLKSWFKGEHIASF